DRPCAQRRPRDIGRAQCAPSRHLRALSEDQEFPLARERTAFPRLPPPARRAGRPVGKQHRHSGRTGAQDRRQHHPLYRAYRQAATDQGQRQELRACDRHAARADERQQGSDPAHAQGARTRRRARRRGDGKLPRGLHRRSGKALLVPIRGEPPSGALGPLSAVPLLAPTRVPAGAISRRPLEQAGQAAASIVWSASSCPSLLDLAMDPSRDIARLLEIMAALRTPGTGCPWDLEQTFETIAPYTIEEAYEVADAIARGDLDDLRDELGDLLLQVVFHARNFADVVERLTAKLVRRHPHVFGETRGLTPEAVEGLWERIKTAERAEKAGK